MTPSVQTPDPLEDQPFHELMQTYRHMPYHELTGIVEAFEAVKAWIREYARTHGPQP